ncbi:nitrogenase iron protein NifH [Desulfosporosinus sp.]|uniref:nitrogenase iron protein NifH n=1 Tax=Desulfosporosinus sp. TaxID=157907 RepID=UPI00261F1424|nr:nitrogenase iron protein NifH [Desulfosporosinus sp.]MCO5385302.1 nitrogenase iron protein NifH [Desulfosporosinus sp.]
MNAQKERNCLRIAFYGKGGIGKSTVAANISAALAMQGLKILHIGCDPKADSARCLVGRKIPTVLQQLHTKQDGISLQDIVFLGFSGVNCIEAGGPEAGIGCAGRGIITMMEELKYLELWDEVWDAVVYDVLGDVVCGGFSVPMREGYADTIYIVTSSEFMSIYAANNIMKAISRSQGTRPVTLGGLIHNCRNGESSRAAVEQFAILTGTRVVADVPFSREIALSELEGKTVLEKFPDSQAACFFKDLAGVITENQGYRRVKALDDDELEKFSHYMLDLELRKA